ncbi:F-box only protein 30-like isoform X1 [Scleropages formosus]|nr:F-box only protein 30-like isoform X1 [Scleropages formosus]
MSTSYFYGIIIIILLPSFRATLNMEAACDPQRKECDFPATETRHLHCEACLNRRCMARPEVGVACELIGCPLVCGAVFHACKTDEHRLLCPLERTPCLNSAFGCPFTVPRNKVAEHLEVCPASVVCCTMEWNRWPVGYADRVSYENLSRDVDQTEQLDMALALQDQQMLLESLKVATMMPHGIREQRGVSEKVTAVQSSAQEKVTNGTGHLGEDLANGFLSEGRTDGDGELHDDPRLKAPHLDCVVSDRDLGAVGGVVRAVPHAGDHAGDNRHAEENGFSGFLEEVAGKKEAANLKTKDQGSPHNGFHGNGAPDQGRLAERDSGAGEAQHPDANGFWDAVQAEKDQEIQSHSIAVEVQEGSRSERSTLLPEDTRNEGPRDSAPHSFDGRVGGRVLPLPGSGKALFSQPFQVRVETEDKAVDTSDLDVPEGPEGVHGVDLVTAALLFCLGDSPGGRGGVSESSRVPILRADAATQTFSFPSAILATRTMVGDIASASACDHANPQLSNPSPFGTLRLDLVLECVARYQTKQRSMFTFVCGQLFRRDEFSSHFKNVHGDIHAGLNGWMERRCPLAYYGCTFSQRRFCPSVQGSRVVHDRHLRSFGVRPGPPPAEQIAAGRPGCDRLSGLPFEVLQHVAAFLDGFSLCQLSRVSRTMRDLCSSLLQTRGMVVLLWEKRRGAPCWRIKNKVWRFSTAFGTVREWKFADIASMADHLRECRFNAVERRLEAVPLPCMCFTRELTKDGRSLRSVLKPVA